MIVRSIRRTAKSLSNSMLILSETDTRRCFTVPDAISTTRKALASLVKDGGGEVPKRIGLPFFTAASSSSSKSSPDDWSLFKPAAFYPATTTDSTDDDEILMGMKMVSIRAHNPEKINKGTVLATTMLLNSETGEVSAIVAATYLTGVRTAAGSALATQLAFKNRNTSNGLMMVIFGAGLQAELHIKCIQHVVNITRLVIINRSIGRADELKEMILNDQPDLESETKTAITDITIILLSDIKGVENAVQNADIICTTTNTCTPLFRGELLKPGCHINGVGSYTPSMQEIDDATVQRSEILIDTIEALDVGDLSSLKNGNDELNCNVPGLIGDALVGNIKFCIRRDDRDCTLYKSVGTAIMDVFAAQKAVQNAKLLNIGVKVDM
jgi:ornithine cyclodeaminase